MGGDDCLDACAAKIEPEMVWPCFPQDQPSITLVLYNHKFAEQRARADAPMA